MPYYLAPYKGSGTRADPFRPEGSDQPGWSAIDLRPDASVLTGRCLLYLPVADANPLLRKLSDNKDELIGVSNRNFLRTTLSSPSLEDDTLANTVAALLLRPPVGAWNRLQATGDHYEIHLGGPIWQSPIIFGASDDFNRANETPIASPWTKSGPGPNANLTSNAMTETVGNDTFYYYSGAATSANQYSQAKVTAAGGGSGSEWGPAARIQVSALYDGYFNDCLPGSEGIYKYVASTASLVQAVTYTMAVNDIVRIEAQGSTLRFIANGTERTGSPGTDTSITDAGGGPGVFLLSNTVVIDDWAGGDLAAPFNEISMTGEPFWS